MKTKKLDYQKPMVHVTKTACPILLAGTTETMRFNPNQGTTEALSRNADSQEWDDEE